MQLVFDIETDGFLEDMTKCHVLVCQDVVSKKLYTFTDIQNGLDFMKNADALIGHNIIGFDLMALDKLYGWKPSSKTVLIDTWIMSQTLQFNRQHKHGLAGWGGYLGFKKMDNSEWAADGFKTYDPRMIDYCIQDVKLNTKVYEVLLAELEKAIQINDLIKKGLRVEHDVAEFEAVVRKTGWLFDLSKAQENLRLMTRHMNKIESIIEPKLGTTKVFIDKAPKTAKYTKKGLYTATTARILSEYLGSNVIGEDALSDNPPIKPGQEFQRSKIEKVTLSNMELVKQWLLTIGWKPDDWNVKRGHRGDWIRTGPKLTSTSLAKLGRQGKLIDRYYTIKNRKATIESWLERIQKDDTGNYRLHGRMFTIGTPSFRCRHEVIVNLPAVDAAYGRMLRELFIAEPGYRVVGADSAGNQLRGLCHYVGDKSYTDLVVNGDQHTRNADVLDCSRSVAKSFLYAILFGAGDAKLGQTLTGVSSAPKGKEARQKFMNNLPGFEQLVNKLRGVFNQYGCIPGLDGRKIFARSDYQVLNYLLQTTEGITCKAALSYAMNKIKEEKLDAYPAIFYHDEQAWIASDKDSKRVGEILQESFREAPKWFGVECMDGGNYVIGNSYAEVH